MTICSRCWSSDYTFERCCAGEIASQASESTLLNILRGDKFRLWWVGLLQHTFLRVAISTFLERERDQKSISTGRGDVDNSTRRSPRNAVVDDEPRSGFLLAALHTACRKLSTISFSVLVTHMFAYHPIVIAFGHLERISAGNFVSIASTIVAQIVAALVLGVVVFTCVEGPWFVLLNKVQEFVSTRGVRFGDLVRLRFVGGTRSKAKFA